MTLTKQQQHDLIIAESKALHERLEVLLERKVDVILIVHRRSIAGDNGCETSVGTHVHYEDRTHDDDLVAHMLDEAISVALPDYVDIADLDIVAGPPKARRH